MKRERFSDEVRRAVDASGSTRYAICKAIGIPESVLSRFMTGKSGLSMGPLDKLAEHLDLSVVTRPGPQKGA